MNNLTNFTDLETWKKSHELVLEVYRLTSKFPDKEKYCLVPQMIRAAVSITSNIAEGFTRKGKKDKTNFYLISKSSLTELQNQLIITRDLSYISDQEFNQTWGLTITCKKLISGLINGVNKNA